MNKKTKALITKKSVLYKLLNQKMLKANSPRKLDTFQAKLLSSINFSQFEYYRKIFKRSSVPSSSTRCY